MQLILDDQTYKLVVMDHYPNQIDMCQESVLVPVPDVYYSNLRDFLKIISANQSNDLGKLPVEIKTLL